MMFLTCAALMAYQVIDRIFYYVDWPVTVDLRINYNNSLSFPALTICNQNAFKTTATAKNNQYELLEDIFSGNLSKLTKYPEWKNITLRQLNLDNGHRKEDMIINVMTIVLLLVAYVAFKFLICVLDKDIHLELQFVD
ncbi:hypothetical protein KUTeg_004833 [Tegillarca granosa]|uniref:Uncharacterized protein n=1 Tax=Tegillarca granosa TaxID=220873 RepID=A0ABQ9FI03_TEGGR|nr:hypothetical protein KUTeg_004833 [Tegillarca granosa]